MRILLIDYDAGTGELGGDTHSFDLAKEWKQSGAAALIVACVVVIVVDRSNKKLRDYEMTMEKFKVPVLGIIPSIEEMNQAAEAKKQQNKGARK